MSCALVAARSEDCRATEAPVSAAELNQKGPALDLTATHPSDPTTHPSGPSTESVKGLKGSEATWCSDGNAKRSSWPELKTYKQSSFETSEILAANARLLNFTLRAVGCSRSCRRNTLQLVACTASRKVSQRCNIRTFRAAGLVGKLWIPRMVSSRQN